MDNENANSSVKNDNIAIGQRVKEARKKKGYTQTKLAEILGMSIRTIQKYEYGDIEISLSMINELASVLDTTSSYLLGYDTKVVKSEITTFADVADMLFELEKVAGLEFVVDVKRPPRDDNWECALRFNGKAKTELNADMCLFLEDWKAAMEREDYEEWKDRTLAYYSRLSVSTKTEIEDNAITAKVPPNIEF